MKRHARGHAFGARGPALEIDGDENEDEKGYNLFGGGNAWKCAHS